MSEITIADVRALASNPHAHRLAMMLHDGVHAGDFIETLTHVLNAVAVHHALSGVPYDRLRSRLSLGKAVQEAIDHYESIREDPTTQDVALSILLTRGVQIMREGSEAKP